MLFTKTVGPVKDTFLVYNSQGKSKGMAVVTFALPGGAAVARTKYHGKIVDGSECHASFHLRRAPHFTEDGRWAIAPTGLAYHAS